MRFITLVIGVAVFGACSSSDGGGGGNALGPQGLDGWCAHNCAKQHECIGDDESTCVASCKNSLTTSSEKVRADYFNAYSGCLDGVACAKWATDSKACPAVAKASLAPTDVVKATCEQLAKKQKDCSQPVTDTATCLEAFKVFSDAAVADAGACTSKSCADYGHCVTVSIGGK